MIEEFEEFVEPFIAAVKLGKFMLTFGLDTMNHPTRHMMSDLAHIPVSSWPSLSAYSAFKKFWFSQCELERLAALPGVSPEIVQKILDNREAGLHALKKGLGKL